MARRDARLRKLHPQLTTVAVTGTNGKTTTTSMVADVVRASGEPWSRVTTLGTWVCGEQLAEDGSMTSFVRALERAVERGVRTLAVETTSRSLAAGFARRWAPQVAVFTNLSRDHLDRHGSVEEYLAAKAQLFLALPPGGVAVLNAADPASGLLAEVLPPGVRSAAYVVGAPHEDCAAMDVALAAEEVRPMREGTEVRLRPSDLAGRLGGRLHLRVVGAVNAHNALAAALAADAAGYAADTIRAGLERFAGVPGRFEVVSLRPLVVVDYAHTPDALEGSLATARQLVAREGGRVLCVFGCGGDRDRGKRAEMGRVADVGADRVVLTNDNPRTEDPVAIADMVEAGAGEGGARWVRVLDRGSAIALALGEAGPDDAVLIAGKGHETFQVVGDRHLPFSDVAVARQALGRSTSLA